MERNRGFNGKQFKEASSIVYKSLKEFNEKYYKEFALLKSLLSNPIVTYEIKRIHITGNINLPKRDKAALSASLYFPSIYRTSVKSLSSSGSCNLYKQKEYEMLKLSSKRNSKNNNHTRNVIDLIRTESTNINDKNIRKSHFSKDKIPSQYGSYTNRNE